MTAATTERLGHTVGARVDGVDCDRMHRTTLAGDEVIQ